MGPVMAFRFDILTGGRTPIYRQLIEQVRGGVARRELEAGVQLPSVRALAEQLVINPNTVARAYGELVRDGLVEGRQGKGFFVARKRRVYGRAERRRRLEAALDSFVSEAVVLDFTPEQICQAVAERLQQIEASQPPAGEPDDE